MKLATKASRAPSVRTQLSWQLSRMATSPICPTITPATSRTPGHQTLRAGVPPFRLFTTRTARWSATGKEAPLDRIVSRSCACTTASSDQHEPLARSLRTCSCCLCTANTMNSNTMLIHVVRRCQCSQEIEFTDAAGYSTFLEVNMDPAIMNDPIKYNMSIWKTSESCPAWLTGTPLRSSWQDALHVLIWKLLSRPNHRGCPLHLRSQRRLDGVQQELLPACRGTFSHFHHFERR